METIQADTSEGSDLKVLASGHPRPGSGGAKSLLTHSDGAILIPGWRHN